MLQPGVDHFHSRDHQLDKFLRAKQSLHMRVQSPWGFLVDKDGRRLIVLYRGCRDVKKGSRMRKMERFLKNAFRQTCHNSYRGVTYNTQESSTFIVWGEFISIQLKSVVSIQT